MVFRDSLKFFNMTLEKLPATFNLQEMYKGFFAYSWIRPEKYDYVGEYAPVEHYHPERITEKRRKEFLTWHKEKVESNAVFDFQKELSAYLRSDVEVPNGSLAAFSEEMVELTGIDPVTQDYRQHCVPGVEENVSRKKFNCPRTKKWMAATSDESEQRGHRVA